jgi:AcrR family transcriptional regulator
LPRGSATLLEKPKEGDRTDDLPPAGLRERKKAKTRALIQAEALRLFRQRGYSETSVEDIAEAAEVSPRTVFRYFPAKPDLVRYDAFDEDLREAIRTQPRSLSAVGAIRAAMHTFFAALSGADLELQQERERLMRAVPELRAAMLDELARTVGELAAVIAERSDRPPDDDEVLAVAGAVIGVMIAIWLGGSEAEWSTDLVPRMDRYLALLETGFRL